MVKVTILVKYCSKEISKKSLNDEIFLKKIKMKQTYIIHGMTCNGCVAKVKQSLKALQEVKTADIQLEAPQGKLELLKPVSLDVLQKAIGDYQIEKVKRAIENASPAVPETSFTTYQPLILIIAFIVGVTLLVQYPFHNFSPMLWMRHFMAGFFLVFAFFKLLNIEGFANSYQMYDIIAERWKGWGYVYPFVELGLGIMFLINLFPFWVNIVTIVVLGVSSIGVIKSNLDKRKIKCACLGDVFNLPMSTVTIVEDLSMVVMAIIMLWLM